MDVVTLALSKPTVIDLNDEKYASGSVTDLGTIIASFILSCPEGTTRKQFKGVDNSALLNDVPANRPCFFKFSVSISTDTLTASDMFAAKSYLNGKLMQVSFTGHILYLDIAYDFSCILTLDSIEIIATVLSKEV